MSFCLIILAGGNSHRFRSNVGKPYQKIAGKSLVEINVDKARQFKQEQDRITNKFKIYFNIFCFYFKSVKSLNFLDGSIFKHFFNSFFYFELHMEQEKKDAQNVKILIEKTIDY